MAIVAPMAEWRPFSGKSTTPLTHDIICLHTMVGTLLGSYNFASQPGNAYWHFGMSCTGALWQCQDLAYRSAANLNGNWHVIPIETADMDGCFGPWSGCGNVPAWTNAQVDKLVELIVWLCTRFNIPAELIPDTLLGHRGIAYHRQGINPWRVPGGELWSNATGKCCPDWRRIAQLTEQIIPRVQRLIAPAPPKDWFDMATQADLEDVIRRQGPWLGQVDGDPSNALFIFDGGTRTWVASQEAVTVLRDYFKNLHTDAGQPWTPTLAEAKGFHLVNRAELEAHLGHPYEF